MEKRYCLTLNLKKDPALIQQYEAHHKAVWPDILKSIKDSGILHLEIYRHDTSLFMIMEVTADFSFEKKGLADKENEKVQEWENLMWQYQEALPGSKQGEKWVLMDKLFTI